jgi:hypothetical protein
MKPKASATQHKKALDESFDKHRIKTRSTKNLEEKIRSSHAKAQAAFSMRAN